MILKILKYSFALLLISLCLPAKAQRDKATADTVPPQQRVRGIQYESKEAAAAAAAKADEGKLLKGFAVGGDVVGIAMGIFAPYGQYEGFFRVNLGNRFFPIAEVGWGVSDHTDETTQIHYKSNAPFFRIGCDYNVANDKKSGNRIFFGLRYAFTSFKYDLDGPDLADPVYGDAMPFSFHGLKGGQHWLELAGGLEARICRFFHIGWTLRYRQRIHEKKADVGSAWYVPGYGKQGNHAISGTFNLVFDL